MINQSFFLHHVLLPQGFPINCVAREVHLVNDAPHSNQAVSPAYELPIDWSALGEYNIRPGYHVRVDIVDLDNVPLAREGIYDQGLLTSNPGVVDGTPQAASRGGILMAPARFTGRVTISYGEATDPLRIGKPSPTSYHGLLPYSLVAGSHIAGGWQGVFLLGEPHTSLILRNVATGISAPTQLRYTLFGWDLISDEVDGVINFGGISLGADRDNPAFTIAPNVSSLAAAQRSDVTSSAILFGFMKMYPWFDILDIVTKAAVLLTATKDVYPLGESAGG